MDWTVLGCAEVWWNNLNTLVIRPESTLDSMTWTLTWWTWVQLYSDSTSLRRLQWLASALTKNVLQCIRLGLDLKTWIRLGLNHLDSLFPPSLLSGLEFRQTLKSDFISVNLDSLFTSLLGGLGLRLNLFFFFSFQYKNKLKSHWLGWCHEKKNKLFVPNP